MKAGGRSCDVDCICGSGDMFVDCSCVSAGGGLCDVDCICGSGDMFVDCSCVSAGGRSCDVDCCFVSAGGGLCAGFPHFFQFQIQGLFQDFSRLNR